MVARRHVANIHSDIWHLQISTLTQNTSRPLVFQRRHHKEKQIAEFCTAAGMGMVRLNEIRFIIGLASGTPREICRGSVVD